MQQSETGTSDNRLFAIADPRLLVAERSQRSTAVLLWLGMAVVHILSAVVWLHLWRHGYTKR